MNVLALGYEKKVMFCPNWSAEVTPLLVDICEVDSGSYPLKSFAWIKKALFTLK